MIGDIVAALVIFFIGIPIALAGVLLLVSETLKNPLRTAVILLILFGILASIK
jgi:hypothetical protein